MLIKREYGCFTCEKVFEVIVDTNDDRVAVLCPDCRTPTTSWYPPLSDDYIVRHDD